MFTTGSDLLSQELEPSIFKSGLKPSRYRDVDDIEPGTCNPRKRRRKDETSIGNVIILRVSFVFPFKKSLSKK